MAIPDYQTIMLPLLKFAADRQNHSIQEAVDALADHFHLTEEELRELLPSGTQTVFRNRIGWAKSYMKQADLIEPAGRGLFQITQRGIEVLSQKPDRIDVKFLEQFPEFQEFRKRKKPPPSPPPDPDGNGDVTPEEALETAYENLKNELAAKLLQHIKKSPADLFERIVVDVLVKMGYGGSVKDAGQAVGKSGDEGIDGIIKEDKLGLDIIYIQAKKWDSTTVGRPEIQKFAGALQGKRANKGVFITTSNFSRDALDFVSKISTRIILIDGEQLARYMIEHNVGVSPVSTYELKRIDSDYFTDE